MYKRLEELYKKEWIYNKFMRNLTITFTIIVIIGFLLSFTKINFIIVLISTIFAIFIAFLIILSKNLKVKISFNFKKNILNKIIIQKNEDKIKIKKYLQKNNLYYKDTIMTMLEHYRNLISTEQKTYNFLSFIAVVYTIAIAFYNNREYLDINFLLYLLFIFIICIVSHLIYKNLCIYINYLKGIDGLYEGLEEILSEIYSELVSKKTIKNRIINFLKLPVE